MRYGLFEPSCHNDRTTSANGAPGAFTKHCPCVRIARRSKSLFVAAHFNKNDSAGGLACARNFTDPQGNRLDNRTMWSSLAYGNCNSTDGAQESTQCAPWRSWRRGTCSEELCRKQFSRSDRNAAHTDSNPSHPSIGEAGSHSIDQKDCSGAKLCGPA